MSKQKNAVVICVFAMCLVSTVRAVCQVQEELVKPKEKNDKIALLFKVSRGALTGATVLDSISTYRSMDHPTLASQPDGTVVTRYYGIETGWASVFGNRNKFAAVGGNMLLNSGVDFASRSIYRRGGRWRILAIAIEGAKAFDNTRAGIHNIRWNDSVNRRVSMATGYSGPLVWSH